MTISWRAHDLRGSRLVELLSLAATRDAIDLALGIPGCPETPPALLAAACHALHSGQNQYADPVGDRGLRARIAESLTTPADPDTEVTVTVGATEGLAVALLSTVDPGDEVVVLEPYYENFLDAIRLAGATPRFVRLHEPAWRWQPGAIASAVGPRTRALLLNSPHNPTGRVFTRAELDEIAGVCEARNITVIADEVYAACVFDGNPHVSVADVPGLRERSIVVGSLSKSHAVSGWRLGYLRADAARTAVLRRVHGALTNGAAAPLQHAVARVGLGDCAPARQLATRRDIALDILTRFGLRCLRPEGGVFLLADIRPLTGEPADEFARELLDRHGVLVAPGPLFTTGGEHLVRIAFNRSAEVLEAAGEALLGVPCRPSR